MKLTIEINCDNAAFDRRWSAEARFIINQFFSIVSDMKRKEAINTGEWKLRDTNGNTVGHATITEE